MSDQSAALSNKRHYESSRIVAAYSKVVGGGLTVPERLCLSHFEGKAFNGGVLDIGIGAGRTCQPLSSMFRRYVGIDYSVSLIEEAKARFPDLDLRVMDARELSFKEVFDCVFFSFNGIDYVPLRDREKILDEMIRVLKPGGYLVYSTHNIGYSRVSAWMTSLLPSELFRSMRTVSSLPSRLKNFVKQNHDRAGGVALVNDPGLGFRLMTIYVDIDNEELTLIRRGLNVLAKIGNAKTKCGFDSADCWVYFVARKK